MIKAAIDKILSLSKINEIEHDGKIHVDKNLHWLKPSKCFTPDVMNFSTLTGMADFIRDNQTELVISEGSKDVLMLVVDSPTKVSLHGRLQTDNNNSRFLYAESKLVSTNFGFGNFYDLETFIIALQSQFVPTNEIEEILSHIGNLANENVVEQKDDRFSQSIQVKTGITTKSEVKIKNPVNVQPYRTFREIDQPESSCILRFNSKMEKRLHVALFVSDGDAWKLEAMQNIKTWLNDNLDDIKVIA